MLKTLIKKIRKSKGGFTLIELIVVIAILAILAVVLIPTISGQIKKANDSRCANDANSVYTACSLVAADLQTQGKSLTASASEDPLNDSNLTGYADFATTFGTLVNTGASNSWKNGMTVLMKTDAKGSVTSVEVKENGSDETYPTT